MDLGMCWTDNLRDMIMIQNHLYWTRSDWNNQQAPVSNYSTNEGSRAYWGWNEVPVDRAFVSSKANWDAVLIKLPAAMQDDGRADTLEMLGNRHVKALKRDVTQYVAEGYRSRG